MIVRALTTCKFLRPRNWTFAVVLANFPAKRLLHYSEKVKVVQMADEDIAVTTFRNYLRIDTEQPNPDYKACEEFLQSYAKELQIKCTSVECVPGKPVVIMTIEGQNPSLPSLFLYSHTDVVPTFKEHWKYDPYSAHKDEHGNIYARGTQDMKCVGIQYMEALRRLKQQGECNFLRTIHIVWGPDEEISGSDGMKIFVQHPKFKELNIGFALDEGIASEDETYKVFCGERCIWWLKVICKGSPGHGSKFIKNTAGAKLQSIINSLLAYRDEQEHILNSDPKLTIGDVTTVNLTKVEGGVQLNVIPAELIAYFDIRIPPTADFDKLEAQIGEWCKQAGSDVSHEFLQYYKITTMTSSSKDDPWWNAFSSVLDELHLKYKTEIFVGATDSRYLRELNYKAIGFSPMINTPQLLHDHNEFLNENVFLRGVDIYAKLIPRLANLPDH